MLSRILIPILSMALLAGCSAPSTATPVKSVETKSPAFSLVKTPPAETQFTITEMPEVTETQPQASAPTQASSATPETTETTEISGWPGWIAFINPDGNVALFNIISGKNQPVTNDAASSQPGQPPGQVEITYSSPKWSSNGSRLAFLKQVGTPIETGYQYEISLMVYDFATGQSSALVAGQQITGFDWKPGSTLIAYGLPVDQNYFLNKNTSLATGINGVQVDTGEITTLVEPKRGFPLVSPRWSPDGRFLAFEEVQYLEGRGLFALYDFDVQQYQPWEEVIGNYSLSPDNKSIAFDRLAYVPTGEERIYLSDLTGENQQPLSPEIDQGYAFSPAFSPQGNRLAYFTEVGDPANSQYKLFMIPVSGGKPQELGNFDQPQGINWFPDGESLLVSTGPFDAMKLVQVSVKNGAIRVLTDGSQPAVQPITQ